MMRCGPGPALEEMMYRLGLDAISTALFHLTYAVDW